MTGRADLAALLDQVVASSRANLETRTVLLGLDEWTALLAALREQLANHEQKER